jgi:hypothetical protein
MGLLFYILMGILWVYLVLSDFILSVIFWYYFMDNVGVDYLQALILVFSIFFIFRYYFFVRLFGCKKFF